MPRKQVIFTGQKEIIKKLNKVAKKMKHNLYPAMVHVVTTIQKTSMEYTPVKTGNLVNSHRIRVIKIGRGVIGSIYLLANYALFVHEANPSTKFQSPWPKGRKFLERAMVDNLVKINLILRGWLTK